MEQIADVIKYVSRLTPNVLPHCASIYPLTDKSNRAFLHDETIIIFLDQGEETFTASKALLYSSSNFFKDVLHSTEFRLHSCDKETFQLFMFYLVEKKLPEPPTDNAAFYNDGVSLAKLWIFAGRVGMPKLQNEAMRHILTHLRQWLIKPDLIEFAYQNCLEGSILRKVAVWEAVADHVHETPAGDKSEVMSRLGALPGFFYDFVNRLDDYQYPGDCYQPSDLVEIHEYMVVE